MKRSEESPERVFLSGARLTGLRLTLPARRAELESELRLRGLDGLRKLGDYPEDQHPICCEFWRVTQGRLEFAGLDQHEWSTKIAAIAGLRGLWGAGGRGASAVSRALAGRALAWSQRGSAWLGTYHELLIAVPEVILRGSRHDCHTLVLGMITDSPLAVWGDVAFGFGYCKQLGTFETAGGGHWNVTDREGRRMLALRAELVERPHADFAVTEIDACFQRPLLGGLDRRKLVGSELRRSLLAPGVRLARAEGALELFEDLSLGVKAGRYELAPPLPQTRWGAFGFSDLLARVSYPWRASAV